MIVELRNLVYSVKKTVASDSSLAKFNRTVGNFERLSASLADYMERNRAKLDGSVDNFHRVSQELNRLVADNSRRVDSSIQRVDRISQNLDLFVMRMDTVSVRLRDFAEAINNPEGTVQLLANDRRLYDDLRKTADNIDDLVTDIRENPRKYINLKVELF
jgi:phospholipid/cholesterol/gamma-HCH transport system substrate-binding protein